MNRVIIEDMEYIRNRTENGHFDGSTVLVSGATGLIGKYLVYYFARYCGCKVIVIVRDMDKAYQLWNDLGDNVEYIHSDITQLEARDMSVDYVIHAAGITSSRLFSEQPAEVIYESVQGTRKMLEFARNNPVKSFVFLSTMEVYGTPQTENRITELHGSNLDTMVPRASYPESKRLCETLCAAYFSQYRVPVRVVRLTQTFGPGVECNDSRVFAEFARCAMEKRDIVLHTGGGTKRSYLYLADACTAILQVMMKGTNGEAYNAANEDTYCSIRQMAELVAKKTAKGSIQVRIEPDDGLRRKLGYMSELKMNLDTSKLRKTGWKPEVGLSEMYERMLACMGTDTGKGK